MRRPKRYIYREEVIAGTPCLKHALSGKTLILYALEIDHQAKLLLIGSFLRKAFLQAPEGRLSRI